MTTSGDGDVDSAATGPDWGQVALVALAVATLALAAVAVPGLGGASIGGGLGGLGDGAADASELPSLGEDDEEPADGDSDDEGSDADDGDGVDDQPAADGADGDPDDGVADDQPGADRDEVGPDEADADEEMVDPADADAADGDDSQFDDATDEAADADGDPLEAGAEQEPADEEAGEPADGGEMDDSTADDGEPADGDGEPTDADGEPADADGEPVDDGEPTDGDGEPTDADGEPTDGDGEPADADGESVDDGEPADADGEPADDGDPTADDGDDGETDETTVDVGEDDADADDADADADADADDADGADADDPATEDEEPADEPDGEAEADGEEDDLVAEDADADDEATYAVSFEDDLTPGGEATATVTEDGEPVEGATVFFDGEAVGTTDADGQVTGTVPFTTELEVTIDPGAESQPSIARAGAGAPGAGGPGPQLSGAATDPDVAPQTASNQTGEIFELEAETALEVEEPLVPGEEASVTATVNDVPIPDGTILIDDDEVGTTDGDGTAAVTVPESVADADDGPHEATVAVERDEIRASEVVSVRALAVEVDTLVMLPGRTVDLSVTDGGEPVDGAAIAVADGTGGVDPTEPDDQVATTDNGTATAELPVAGAATIGVTHEGATAETTITGLYRNAAILALVVLGVGGLLVRTAAGRVSGETVRSFPSRLIAFVTSLGTRAVDAVVSLADAIARLGSWLVARLRDGLAALERAGRWLIGLPHALATRGLVALAALDPRRLWRWLVAVGRSLLASSRQRLADARSEPGSVSNASGRSGASAVDEATVTTIRELWTEFVRLVRPPRLRTKTPGEVGRYAVKRGFPERPVRTVVEAFRDVEYGRRPQDRERLERVRSAVDAVDGEDDDADADAPGDGEPTDSGAGGVEP